MLTSLAYLFIAGLSLGCLFNKLRLPALVGMILSGILLGPYCLNLLDDSLLNISIEIRQIALIIILLRAGLALNLGDLKQVGRPAILLCFVPACFEIAACMLLAPTLLGVTLLEAAIMGSVIAAVSPAVVVPKMLKMMEEKRGTKKGIPQMIMAAGSVDDVFVIVLFTAFTTLALGGSINGATLLEIPSSILFGALMGLATGIAIAAYFKRFHTRDTIKVLILLSISFLFVTIEQWAKGSFAISGLLAVMVMGITLLSRYPILAKRISPKLNKIWVAAEVLLFVLVGATVDISYAAAAGITAVTLILLSMIFRMCGVLSAVVKTPLNTKERLFCMIAYSPKATVQAAIGSLPLAMGLPCGEIVLTVAVLSILITAPLGAFGIDTTYKRLVAEQTHEK
ncbi:MAG: cation:proton antiporter [Rikenellaceae bacterium]